MGKDGVEVFATFVDDCRQADYLGAGADNDEEFQLAVVGKVDVFIFGFHLFTGSK